MTTSGTRFEQGDILIVPFPFSDLSAIKQRPVLVLSKENTGPDIITCGITSNLNDRERSVLIDETNLQSGGIPVKSRIKVDKLFTLESTIVRKRIAKLDEKTFAQAREQFLDLI